MYLVTSSISQPGEQTEELLARWRRSFVFEDDLVQLLCVNDLAVVAHQSLCDGIDLHLPIVSTPLPTSLV